MTTGRTAPRMGRCLMPNFVQVGEQSWVNLDFVIKADAYGLTPDAPPGPGWFRLLTLIGQAVDVPAAYVAELRRRIEILAGTSPSGPPDQAGEPKSESAPEAREIPVRVRPIDLPAAPAVDDPAADQPQHGDAI
jgi:hypothetical protein